MVAGMGRDGRHGSGPRRASGASCIEGVGAGRVKYGGKGDAGLVVRWTCLESAKVGWKV
jgi:hypothetical protein